MTSRVRYRQIFIVIVLFQVLTAVLHSLQSYSAIYPAVSWGRLTVYFLSINLIWVMLAPLVLWLSHRYPIERFRWKSRLAIHLVTGMVMSLAALAPQAAIDRYFRVFPAMAAGGLWNEYVHLVQMYVYGATMSTPQLSSGMLIYFVIVGAAHASSFHELFRDRELQAARLNEQLAQSRLQVLRSQLQPHFLFNTLNSIVGLIRSNENKAAIGMTTQLGDLLRQVLEHSNNAETSLREEIKFTKQYLEIQQMRFSDRLHFEIHADPDALDAKVPSLILQPIVENALRHGVAERVSASRVIIQAKRENDTLAVEIYNDGPTLPELWRIENCTGLGLANTRARLLQHYGEGHTITLSNRGNEGVVTNLMIPFSN